MMSIFKSLFGPGNKAVSHATQTLEADKKALSDMLGRHRDDLTNVRRQLLSASMQVELFRRQWDAAEKRAAEAKGKLADKEKELQFTLDQVVQMGKKFEELSKPKVAPVGRRPGRPKKILLGSQPNA